jgi:coenzyme F420 biosynthesis associated uncharacterized protein
MALVDWDLATSTAAKLGPGGPAISLEEATSVVHELRDLADEATGHVTEYTGLSPELPDHGVRVVDRQTWAAVNVAGLREVISPLADKLAAKAGPLTNAVTSKVAGVQAGTLLAYLSGKVLGQYDVFAVSPGQLLLVAPNIVAVQRRLGAVPRDFRLWVALHEATHRAQFTGVPWLRDHFLSEVRAYVNASEQPTQFLQQASKIVDAVRGEGGSLLEVIQSPQQREILDRLTALLTLLEGHAEVVMDGVGPAVIPSVAQIRAGFDRRRATANPVEQYLRKLFGMDIKLKQYAEGRKFVSAVIGMTGMQSFNRIFASPQSLPRLSELNDPAAWVSRVAT